MFFEHYAPRYSYDHDDFYRALAAQRAHERREAEYRGRLQEARQRQQFEEALRRNAYQNHLAREHRRRSMYPYFSGFDTDEEYSDSPSYMYSQPAYELRQTPRSQDIYDSLRRQQQAAAEPEPRRKNPSPKRTRSPVAAYGRDDLADLNATPRSYTPPSSPPQTTRIPIRSPSPELDLRDQAARKIQAFFRANMPRHKSFKAISSVAQEFQAVVQDFTFPETPDFGERSDAADLLYTSRNAPIHLHEHTLLNLLSKLDSIDSHGDERVRAARKNLVREIEAELENLDAKKLAAWQARRVASVASVADEKDVPSVESQSQPQLELDDGAMEITEEKVNEVDCPPPSESSSCQPANSPDEQHPVIQLLEEHTQTETRQQDSTKAGDSDVNSSETRPPSSPDELPSDSFDTHTLSAVGPDVELASSIDVEQPHTSDIREPCSDEEPTVNHLEAVVDAVIPTCDPTTSSFSAMPVELCV